MTSHPPTRRHISHPLSLKLRTLVCSYLNCLAFEHNGTAWRITSRPDAPTVLACARVDARSLVDLQWVGEFGSCQHAPTTGSMPSSKVQHLLGTSGQERYLYARGGPNRLPQCGGALADWSKKGGTTQNILFIRLLDVRQQRGCTFTVDVGRQSAHILKTWALPSSGVRDLRKADCREQ